MTATADGRLASLAWDRRLCHVEQAWWRSSSLEQIQSMCESPRSTHAISLGTNGGPDQAGTFFSSFR